MECLLCNKLLIGIAFISILLNISCNINPTISKQSAPTATFTINPKSGTISTSFVFDASGCTDNEDETSILVVRWDWNNDGTYDTDYSSTKIANYQFSTPGTHTVKLQVKDSVGLTNNTSETINIQQQGTIVLFPDLNFENLVREILNITSGDITNIDLKNIIEIYGEGRNISDISGIEYCTNLANLNLRNNEIVDINVLSGLTNLQVLNITNNHIIDINPLLQNNGIDNNDVIYLNRNPLNETSVNTYIPQLEARGVTVSYDVGLSDPFFGLVSENWIPTYQKGPMTSIWASEGINREGYNYYFLSKAVSPFVCSDRFIPTSNYFQAWFGMYTVSDNLDGTYAINNNELNQEDILKLAIADQLAWLRGFGGMETPSVYLDNSIDIVKEKILIDSQYGWKLSGRLISNVDVGNNNQTDVPDIININRQYWEDYVNSYQQVYLDAYAFVWYAHENKELNVAYFNGIEYLSKDGDSRRTIDLIYSELEEMVLNITVYE